MAITRAETYVIPFGPAHPGSGNFRVWLTVDGERVIEARADPGFLHRGFEKLMEYRTLLQASVLTDRIAVFEPLNWNLVFALAAEKLQGIEVPERAKYIRVLLVELTRIQSHLLWFGVAGIAMGFDTVFKVALTYREEILRLFEEATGGRVYPAGYIRPGGVRWDLPEGFLERAEGVLRHIEYHLSDLNNLFFENPSFVARTKGLAVLSPEEGIRLGASGPALRASGVPYDVRADDPYLVYDRLEFRVITRREGDALARFLVGRDEVLESVKIGIQAIRDMPEGEHAVKVGPFAKVKEGEAYVHIEAARGDAGCYIIGTGKRTPYRVKFRGPSFTLLIPVLEHLLQGVEIADVPVVYWSLNHCPADMDR